MSEEDSPEEGKFVQGQRGPLGRAYEWVRCRLS